MAEKNHEVRQDLYNKARQAFDVFDEAHGNLEAHMTGHDDSHYDSNNNRVGSCATCELLERRQLFAHARFKGANAKLDWLHD